MLKIINNCLDLLFPPRDSERLIRNLEDKTAPQVFGGTYNDIVILSSYKDPLIKALVKENKYHRHAIASRKLAELFENWLKTQPNNRLIVVPIPQSKERAREREHNQVETILRKVNYLPSHKLNTDLIYKKTHTATQTSLNRNERLENVKGSFSCNVELAATIPAGTAVVIVDDVVTTGATMEAARASIKPHLPPDCAIIHLAIAH